MNRFLALLTQTTAQAQVALYRKPLAGTPWANLTLRQEIFDVPTNSGYGLDNKWLGFDKIDVAALRSRAESFFSNNLTSRVMRFSAEMVGSRREFFRAGLRYGLLALLAATASLAARKPKPSTQRCINRGICSDCGAFSQCELPRALSARKAKG